MSLPRFLAARGWLVFTVSALAAMLVLIHLGLRESSLRTFALGVANQSQVAVLESGKPVCEGPITTPSPAEELEIWGSAVTGVARMKVVLRPQGGTSTLARGVVTASTVPTAYGAILSRPVPARRRVRVCLQATHGSFSLLGSTPADSKVLMTGGRSGLQFSLVMLRPQGQSLLGSLPTAFRRASLFKLSWVGPWTFWLLAGLLLATIIFGSVAISAADREDDQGSAKDGVDNGAHGSLS